MRKLLPLLLVAILLVSCSQEVKNYTAVIENRSSFPVFWRVRRTDGPETGAFSRTGAFQCDYIFVEGEDGYSVDFILFDADGEIRKQETFAIGNPSNVIKITFSSQGQEVFWNIEQR